MDRWMDGCMDAWTDRWTYIIIYIYMVYILSMHSTHAQIIYSIDTKYTCMD